MTNQKDPERTEINILNQYADFHHKRVLEVGCGDGRLTWKYAKTAERILGIDLDTPALRIASIETPEDMREKVHLIQADSIHLPLRSNIFDIALLSWSL